jgi:RimJ/RimL family protein N-acetyltransferase
MSKPVAAKGPPQRVVLEGRYTRLEPIGARHAADLYRASAADPGRFTYLFDDPPQSEAEMVAWIAAAGAKDDPSMFAVVDKATNTTEGRQSLMRTVVEHGVIEIGSIHWGPRLARTRVATEALFLHARYVFDTLGYRRYEWKCNDRNEPSKTAALRFGFAFEGIFRQHMIDKGENRDTAWFAMLDRDWPRIKAGFERWLAPDNFDATGTQKTKLRLA